MISKLQHYQVDHTEPGISKEMYHIALKLIVVIDNIEKQEAALNSNLSESSAKTSILIFLPGLNEIDQMCERLEKVKETDR